MYISPYIYVKYANKRENQNYQNLALTKVYLFIYFDCLFCLFILFDCFIYLFLLNQSNVTRLCNVCYR